MSSYIRFEILLFFHAFEMGTGLVLAYRLLHLILKLLPKSRNWKAAGDLLYWLIAAVVVFVGVYQWNYGRLRLFMLPAAAIGGVFANFVLNRLLFLVKRCKISSYKHTKRRLHCFRRGRRFEKVKKEKKSKKNSE